VISFAKPIDRALGANPQTYALQSYTHIYQQGDGSPEVDQTTPRVAEARVSADGLGVNVTVEGLVQGHVHDFDLQRRRSAKGDRLLHTKAYYTLNEIPRD
tara:strand:+ start:158 stop:457 length:300 start_codon:yes stop_codon:yes gene_type:complete